MRTYGVPAANATEAQIVEALHDASIWAGVYRTAFSVGAAADGVLASTEVAYGKGKGASAGDRLSLVACTAGAGGGFVGRGQMWSTRDIGKAARAVSDCLARGMIAYGSLEFLSGGRAQLRGAALDAQHVIRHLGGWYVLGKTLGYGGIMLAPASMSGRFVAPQSLYVGPLGAWTVSRIHPCRYPMRPSLGAAARPAAGAPGVPGKNGGKVGGAAGRAPGSGKRAREGGRNGGGSPARPPPGQGGGTAGHALPAAAIMYRLYMAMGYRTVEHGRLGPDTGMCLLQLENAIEDAAALGACRRGEEFAALVDGFGGVQIMEVAPGTSADAGPGGVIAGPQGDMLVAAGPEELRYGGSDAEFADAVRDAARRAYGVYCGGQSPRPSLPPNPGEAMRGWARPQAPSPARGSRPPSPWGTMHDWTAGP